MSRKAVSAIILPLLLISSLMLVFNVQPVATGNTIYIRADGSVDPPTAPIQREGDVYTFTDNIYDSIVVKRSNVIIDGAGYILQGTGSGTGFYLSSINNVTIKNTNIKNFSDAVCLNLTSRNGIYGNNITGNNRFGIRLYQSSNNSIYENNVSSNNYGIYLYYSANNTISSNNVNSNAGDGILLISERYKPPSDNNKISNNSISNNWVGISLRSPYSSKNKITNNDISNNRAVGVYTSGYSNEIDNNDISNNNAGGIEISHASYNNVTNNIIDSNNDGIVLGRATENTITSNNINSNNRDGIRSWESSYNKIYHNNLLNNTVQAYTYRSYSNKWDDGYPSGGNYWSDYTDVDLYSGPYQNETGSDGIWDQPYVIDADNQDRYPLVNPWLMFTDDFSTDSGMWSYVEEIFECDSGQILPGSAYRDDVNKYLVLTENRGDQGGVIWLSQDIYSPFTAEFKYKAGGGSGYWSADGLVFMFYKKKGYLPLNGGALGFMTPPTPMTAVPGYGNEFDNFDNQVHYNFPDPSGNHIALIKDSVDNHIINKNDSKTEDNQWHDVKVIVGNYTIEVYVDNELVLTWEGTINRTYGGIGFAGSTAGGSNWHIIDDVTITWTPNQPPTCVVQLQEDGVEIYKIDVRQFFDIYVGDSTDDIGIGEVRFSSDDLQDGNPTGEWTEWYDWDVSQGDWNASTKVKRWSFDTGGEKEVWAEVKDNAGQSDNCSANIYARASFASDFDPSVDGFSFKNWHLMTDMELGDLKNEIRLSIEGVFTLSPKLTNLIYHYAAAGGHCYGMAATSIIYYKHPELKPVQKDTFDMSKEEASLDIARYHVEQYPSLFQVLERRVMGMDVQEEYSKIVENLARDQPVVMMFLFKEDWRERGHAVTVYKVYDFSADIKYVWVYDNENPGLSVLFTFDLKNNQVSSSYYANIKAIYVDVPAPYSYAKTKEKVNDFVFMPEPGSIFIIFKCPVNVTITDQFGRAISEVDNQIPGASLDKYNLTETKIFWLPSNLTYNVQVYANEYGNVTISKMTPVDAYVTAFSQVTFNLTTKTIAQFDLLPPNPNFTLKVDEDGNGTFDYEFMPEVETLTIEYDIGITEIVPSKTVIGQGYYLPINTTIMNYGAYTETFNITIYANETSIASQTVTLASGNSTTITFTWNTTGVARGNYTISAHSTALPNETDTVDNTLTNGWIMVTIPGDVDGDFKVSYKDLFALAAAYGSKPGDPNWDANCDIDDDERVGYKDLFILAANYGKSC